MRREGASEAAPGAVRQAVGGGCRSGWGRVMALQSVPDQKTTVRNNHVPPVKPAEGIRLRSTKDTPNTTSTRQGVLKRGGESVPERQFCKKTACSSYVQPSLVAIGGCRLAAIGGWRLATGGWWRLVVVGGFWWLVIGGWWWLAVVGSWRLVAVGGWWRLAVGGWWSLGAVPKGGP